MITKRNYLVVHRGTHAQSQPFTSLHPYTTSSIKINNTESGRVKAEGKCLRILRFGSLREARGKLYSKHWLPTLMHISSLERWDIKRGNVLSFWLSNGHNSSSREAIVRTTWHNMDIEMVRVAGEMAISFSGISGNQLRNINLFQLRVKPMKYMINQSSPAVSLPAPSCPSATTTSRTCACNFTTGAKG